jgi:transposase
MGNKQREEKIEQLSVGVDLHKSNSTVCVMREDGELLQEEMYRTTDQGYCSFVQRMHGWEEELGCSVALAVETTGNARFFKNWMEGEGFPVVVVNTNKSKVISQSTKKNDRGNA